MLFCRFFWRFWALWCSVVFFSPLDCFGPFQLCSVPDIHLVLAERRESAHSGRMRLGGGDVAWSMTTLHDPASIQANR